MPSEPRKQRVEDLRPGCLSNPHLPPPQHFNRGSPPPIRVCRPPGPGRGARLQVRRRRGGADVPAGTAGPPSAPPLWFQSLVAVTHSWGDWVQWGMFGGDPPLAPTPGETGTASTQHPLHLLALGQGRGRGDPVGAFLKVARPIPFRPSGPRPQVLNGALYTVIERVHEHGAVHQVCGAAGFQSSRRLHIFKFADPLPPPPLQGSCGFPEVGDRIFEQPVAIFSDFLSAADPPPFLVLVISVKSQWLQPNSPSLRSPASQPASHFGLLSYTHREPPPWLVG